MKKLLTALAAVLLLSMALGAIVGPVWNFMSPVSVKAATASPLHEIIQPIKDFFTPTPKLEINKPLPIFTIAPKLPKSTPTPTPKPNETTPKPLTGGGKYMTSEGPLFLSFRDNLTEQLYMFTPMDLSLDGEYHFPLIGSSQQVVGEAKVMVASGMATVNYYLVNGVKMDEDDEFFTFFKDIDSITSVKPSKLQNVKLKFGVPYSVADRLKSDSKVLLYINCPVSYKTNLKGLSPFSFDDPGYIQRVTELIALMD
jgi:hypothetical protein